VCEWAGQAGVGKIFYFQRPNYVWWPDGEKQPKVVQFLAA
jgi:hypothetical protein